MTKPTIEIFDAETGENQVREMTDSEWASEQQRRASNEEIAVARIAKKEAAIAKLAILGLDPEDLSALGFQHNSQT